MTRNIPEPAPQPKTSDKAQQAYAVVEELVRRANLQRTTGTGIVRIDFVQGGLANVKCELNEVIKPTS